MAKKQVTGFDRFFDEQMEDPAFAEAYVAARKEIDAIDQLIRTLDERRIRIGLSKAELARRAQTSPEIIRRFFTAVHGNPTMATVLKIATALDCELQFNDATPAVRRRRVARTG